MIRVGTRVKLVSKRKKYMEASCLNLPLGATGRVRVGTKVAARDFFAEDGDGPMVGVEWDGLIGSGGHSLNGAIESSRGWYIEVGAIAPAGKGK